MGAVNLSARLSVIPTLVLQEASGSDSPSLEALAKGFVYGLDNCCKTFAQAHEMIGALAVAVAEAKVEAREKDQQGFHSPVVEVGCSWLLLDLHLLCHC